ncbi:ribosomal protein S18-alanine N-acetyltransferase [Sneathiella limimaris]|uniref:ribosomal protein S18-alanine N-acetyltransferase n=1 Tax=Sneathiella limimaris TaxID=1964213 RepID=UPI00146E23CD|nr:ribosomal protein S18-alanine N-acetyltransferase [Sneathiella limimaris]
MIYTHEFLNNNSAAKLLATMHAQCFRSAWDQDAFEEILAMEGCIAQITLMDAEPVGFAVYRTVEQEAELLTIGVLPVSRRRGAAKAMLKTGLQHMRFNKVLKVFLEVAASNTSALLLYRKFGFQKIGVRKGYYTSGGKKEDALILAINL